MNSDGPGGTQGYLSEDPCHILQDFSRRRVKTVLDILPIDGPYRNMIALRVLDHYPTILLNLLDRCYFSIVIIPFRIIADEHYLSASFEFDKQFCRIAAFREIPVYLSLEFGAFPWQGGKFVLINLLCLPVMSRKTYGFFLTTQDSSYPLIQFG